MLARAISAHFGDLYLGVLESVQIPLPDPAKYTREHHSQREQKNYVMSRFVIAANVRLRSYSVPMESAALIYASRSAPCI